MTICNINDLLKKKIYFKDNYILSTCFFIKNYSYEFK